MTVQEVNQDRHHQAPADAAARVLRTVEGTALFIDVRASSQIVYLIETHHGSHAAGQVFMGFLAGCMSRVAGPSVQECRPSGDAVLAIFSGPARVRDALDAARDVTRYVRDEFNPRYRRLLSCNGRCGDKACPSVFLFTVGAGIDDGPIAATVVPSPTSRYRELVGSCVSTAAKLSSVASPPTDAVMTFRAYERGHPYRRGLYEWRPSATRVGGKPQQVILTTFKNSY